MLTDVLQINAIRVGWHGLLLLHCRHVFESWGE